MGLQLNFEVEAGKNVASLNNDSTVESLILKNPTTVSNGYVKIDFLSGTKSEISALVSFSKSKGSKNPFFTQQFSFVPSVSDSADNYHRQAYIHLKTLPEFENAIDVFEEGQSI